MAWSGRGMGAWPRAFSHESPTYTCSLRAVWHAGHCCGPQAPLPAQRRPWAPRGRSGGEHGREGRGGGQLGSGSRFKRPPPPLDYASHLNNAGRGAPLHSIVQLMTWQSTLSALPLEQQHLPGGPPKRALHRGWGCSTPGPGRPDPRQCPIRGALPWKGTAPFVACWGEQRGGGNEPGA